LSSTLQPANGGRHFKIVDYTKGTKKSNQLKTLTRFTDVNASILMFFSYINGISLNCKLYYQYYNVCDTNFTLMTAALHDLRMIQRASWALKQEHLTVCTRVTLSIT